jgi:hypothetical protein
MENLNEDIAQEMRRAEDIFKTASELQRLELFLPSKLPEDAFEMWGSMTKMGKLTRLSDKKVGFIQKKRDLYTKLRREYEKTHGFDYKNIDLENSNSQHVLDKKGNKIAPLMQ